MKWKLDAGEGKQLDPAKTQADEQRGFREPSIIEIVNNRIYFYADIEREKILRLNKELATMDSQHISDKEQKSLNELSKIFLHINSYGGCIFSGFSAMDCVLARQSPVITIVDGVCASAATFMSVAGRERLITEHSYILIHQISSLVWGKFEEFKDEYANLNRFMDMIRKIYSERTKIPTPKLNEILKRDLFFDAKQALKYGLVDHIV